MIITKSLDNKTPNPLVDLEKAIETNKRLIEKFKERLGVPTEAIEEKKEVIQPKKTYNSNMLKVASILVVLALCFVVLMSINVPNFYEVICTIVKELFALPTFGESPNMADI